MLVIALLLGLLGLLPSSRLGLDLDVRAIAATGIISLIAVQVFAIAVIRRVVARGGEMPLWLTVTSLVLEALIPSAILLGLVKDAPFPPYAALTAPPILAYGLMISLTTLRLRPWLCVLAGVVCAGGYAGVAIYVRYGLHLQRPTNGLPYAAYVNIPLITLFAGIAGAWVAHEIRTHLQAALGEASARNQVARLEHDLAVARTIQRALLPRRPPAIPGYEVAGWNRSADQTGGDYYDWQELPDKSWIVTLADVSGHGIGPALVTAACRAYMRAGSHYHADLGSLTSRINQLLAEDLPEGRFITLAGVHINAQGPVQLLSAGHGPIVLYVKASGEASDVLPGDLPLAISPDVTFGPAQEINLAPGDMLALVTDGFVEWARANQSGGRVDFGIERLRGSIKRHAHLPAAEIIQAVAGEVAAFAQGEPQQDDLTMVIIRRTADKPVPSV